MARELSKYGVSVSLDTEALTVTVTQFERSQDADGNVDPSGDKTDVATEAFAFDSLAPNAQAFAQCYGLSKLLQDRTSDLSKDRGRVAAMKEVYDRFCAGQLEKEREASGPTVSVEVEALATLQGVPVAVIQKKLRTYTAEQREKILSHPKVTAKAEEISAARSEADDSSFSLDAYAA